MSVELFKAFANGMTDYITRHNSNYTLVEDYLNLLAGLVTTQGQAIFGNGLQFNPAVADHGYSGLTAPFTAGENLGLGNTCYLKSDGKLWKAKADDDATLPVIAMAVDSILADATGLFLLKGFLRDDSWAALTIGGVDGLLYADPATAGWATQTVPVTPGQYKQLLGYAYAEKVLYFDPDFHLEIVV